MIQNDDHFFGCPTLIVGGEGFSGQIFCVSSGQLNLHQALGHIEVSYLVMLDMITLYIQRAVTANLASTVG